MRWWWSSWRFIFPFDLDEEGFDGGGGGSGGGGDISTTLLSHLSSSILLNRGKKIWSITSFNYDQIATS